MKHPEPTDFAVALSADGCSAEVVFTPSESRYAFMRLHPTEWQRHGFVSPEHRERHRRGGDLEPYDRRGVAAMARYLADLEFRKASGRVDV